MLLTIIVSLLITPSSLFAQKTKVQTVSPSSIETGIDTIHAEDFTLSGITVQQKKERTPTPLERAENKKQKRNWATWKPETKMALWLSLVLPGAGQIYNRKYWKLPIIYGGFVGCAYAMRWNNMMYRDYSQAYQDIMDNDPLTQSYNQFLHLGTTITADNTQRWQEIFRKRKDRYRRWRDMSFFVIVGVYALSVIDAYVDASLSEFDISSDLSMRISPTIMNNSIDRNPFKSTAVGLQCSIDF